MEARKLWQTLGAPGASDPLGLLWSRATATEMGLHRRQPALCRKDLTSVTHCSLFFSAPGFSCRTGQAAHRCSVSNHMWVTLKYVGAVAHGTISTQKGRLQLTQNHFFFSLEKNREFGGVFHIFLEGASRLEPLSTHRGEQWRSLMVLTLFLLPSFALRPFSTSTTIKEVTSQMTCLHSNSCLRLWFLENLGKEEDW